MFLVPATAWSADCPMPDKAWATAPSFQKPVKGRLTKSFGMITHPLLMITKMHTGVDFEGAPGDEIDAAASGIVLEADVHGAYGKFVLINHGGDWRTAYAHLATIDVAPGSCVTAGQRIGSRGATGLSAGPHLHFEVRHDGKPVDPAPLLKSSVP